MFNRFIDSHIHFDQYHIKEQKKILSELSTYNIDALITVSTHLKSAQRILQMAKENKKIKPVLGYHPEQDLPKEEEIDQLIQLIKDYHHKIYAIGEVGLPYYFKKEQSIKSNEKYIDLLEKFIVLAKRLNKPIVLHAIYEDAPIACELLEMYSLQKAHFHWFKGDKKTIQQMINNGYYISITPDILYKKRTVELVELYPLHLMMVETDGPWPFEGPFKNQLTHPKMIRHVVWKISDIKQKPFEKVAKIIYQTTKDFYELN